LSVSHSVPFLESAGRNHYIPHPALSSYLPEPRLGATRPGRLTPPCLRALVRVLRPQP
jgi:hypothetical protein